ncbi:two-component system sensor histidine kinase [Planomonospora sphaerica]|uniref:histidine kinase n=1 Tax=Planomonospora sphaerica TaxID=161355 RepID=A0A171AY43_9ACTN|nr:HAMP domain-containing sensor histidine kinase [Planomonospora sphaerica]GAT64439.1 two-component system sensor histidine kinase [Planomonospora sphaerica]
MATKWSVLGEGGRYAARQAAALFALAGVLAVLGIAATPTGRRDLLAVIAGADLLLAAAAWWFPWDRLDPRAPLALSLPALAVLSVSTWAFGGTAAGTAPFYMMLFAWVGLHFPTAAVLALTPPATLAYLVPLVVSGRDPVAVSSVVVFVPTLVGVGVLIARQVDHQRRDRETIRRMERWRAALTAALAHDVRSPLTSVQFAVETLNEDGPDLPEERREAIARVAIRQVDRIRRLAADLLDADRLDSHGTLRLDLHPLDLRAAAEKAVGYLSAPVRVEVPAGLTVRADPQRLEQMLVNLATNAVRYGAPPIVVSAAPAGRGDGELLAVHVRDHGPGIPEDRRSLLFSRFSGAGATPGSVGLGLWITRELARAHGGDAFYAPADPGSRFTVTLPAAGRATAGPATGRVA